MDDGSEIDTSLVVNRLDVMGKEVANLGAAYTVSQNFIEKNVGVSRLIQKAEEFEALCSKFYAKGARSAQAAMEDYVRKVTYRNAKIDEYNALWTRLGDLQGQLGQGRCGSRQQGDCLGAEPEPEPASPGRRFRQPGTCA